MTTRVAAKKRVLIVNCYLDETRRLTGRPHFVPQAVGPVFLAGAFDDRTTELRLYSELYSGPLLDAASLGWPDMLVLTGMTSAYDRMLHLTAYARTLNRRVIIVAGGPSIRQLPTYSQRFFDYCCTGDIEQLRDVARDALGHEYVADVMLPRFDLINWMGHIGYVESSRNCNFRCSFCTLTGEGVSYRTYDIDYLRAQLDAVGWRTCILFIDNNFYGNSKAQFRAKLEVLKEYYQRKAFGGWAALVTSDFFADESNLRLAKESGCLGLFSGIESFDRSQIRRFHKNQNLIVPQVEMIRRCLDSGVAFQYGVIFDIHTRTLEEIRDELAFIMRTPQITLPSSISASRFCARRISMNTWTNRPSCRRLSCAIWTATRWCCDRATASPTWSNFSTAWRRCAGFVARWRGTCSTSGAPIAAR
jgi:hopanoid C-2 methylase